mgnify:FL=1
MVWTQFWDMYSGGRTKIGDFERIYIEAPEERAIEVFRERFGRDPNNVTCECCGEDYITTGSPTLEEATSFDRKELGKGLDLAEYLERNKSTVLVIRASEIDP